MEELTQAAKHYFGADYEKYDQQALGEGLSVVELYIRETKRSIRRCSSATCRTLLPGFYFCCSECEQLHCNGNNYNLCVKCYYDGTFKHQHNSFADNHSILTMIQKGSRYPPCVTEKTIKPGKSFLQSVPVSRKKPKGEGTQESNPKPPVQEIEKGDKGTGKEDAQTDAKKSDTETNISDKGEDKKDLQIVLTQFHTRSTPAETIILGKGEDKKDLQIVAIQSNPRPPLEKKSIEIDEASMKVLTRIAKAHYEAAPERIRESADKFFRSMLMQKGKNSVPMKDFLELMNKKGYAEYSFPEFFQALVEDEDAGMSIWESRTLFYILLSERPFCSSCDHFIPDIYFCCSKCSASSYALCIGCYECKAYQDHVHYGEDGVFFLDYTVLHTTIKTTHSAPPPSSSTAIVKVEEKKKKDNLVTVCNVVKATLKVGEMALSAAGFLGALGACTIM